MHVLIKKIVCQDWKYVQFYELVAKKEVNERRVSGTGYCDSSFTCAVTDVPLNLRLVNTDSLLYLQMFNGQLTF